MNLQSDHQQSGCFDVCNIHQRASAGQRLSHTSLHDGLATEDRQKKKEIDELLAQALTGLTFEERQEHQEIIHGVEERKAEEAPFIESALHDLEIQLISVKEGSMYEVAEQMDPAYVHSRAFLIMFLRANEYSAEESAEQMIRFFECKCKMFGKNKLTKDITMEDLNEDDMATLESGWIQHAGRDQSGRQLFVHFPGGAVPNSPKPVISVIRTQYFVIMRALQSEETQLRGTVSVWYGVGNFKNKSKGKGYKEIYGAARAIPQKKAAIHVCVDDMYQYVLLNLPVKLMKGIVKARMRLHIGSHVECQYWLKTFGISPAMLPIDGHGRLELTRHFKWLCSCAAEDKVAYDPSKTSTRRLETTFNKLNENDVLYGNRNTSHKAGNIRFRAIVKDYSIAYDSANDETKRDLVATVIGKVRASGGRFLKQTRGRDSASSAWEEVPQEELKKKIMQAFRNRRRLDNVSRSKQSVADSASGILIVGAPFPNDVIFGRISQRYPGNELLNRLINDRFEEYESLERGKKIVLVEAIMEQIKNQGGRFLQSSLETGMWMEVSNDNARERISKIFRNQRRQYLKKAK